MRPLEGSGAVRRYPVGYLGGLVSRRSIDQRVVLGGLVRAADTPGSIRGPRNHLLVSAASSPEAMASAAACCAGVMCSPIVRSRATCTSTGRRPSRRACTCGARRAVRILVPLPEQLRTLRSVISPWLGDHVNRRKTDDPQEAGRAPARLGESRSPGRSHCPTVAQTLPESTRLPSTHGHPRGFVSVRNHLVLPRRWRARSRTA